MSDTPQNQPLAAAGFMLATSALLAGTSLLAKALVRGTLGTPLSPLQVSHGRFLFAFIAFLLVSAVLRPQFFRPNLGLHLGRTSFGWAGITLMFAAIAYIPLSDATAISFLNPVFAMIFAIAFLGERVGLIRWSAAVIALFGAVILLRPTSGSFQPGAILALAAALVMGIEIIFTKLLANKEPPIQILLTNNAIGLTIASVAVCFVWTYPEPKQWVGLAALGFMMAMAQSCFIQSMRRAEASFSVPFSYAILLFATLYDYVIFNFVPDYISIIGMAIIISGAMLLALREIKLKSGNK